MAEFEPRPRRSVTESHQQNSRSPCIKTPATRKKRWSAKTKTGCTTCRIRRVKCDEARPTCKRCDKLRMKCDGYRDQVQSPPYSSDHLYQPSYPVLPPDTHATWEEGQLSYFFRTEVAAQMAGPFDREFWTVHLLRSVQTNPVIWHAGNAIAAMIKRYTTPTHTAALQETRHRLYNLSLGQYSASMTKAVEISRQTVISFDDKTAILTACVMFTGLCSLRGHQKEGFVHMLNGLKLFKQWGIWQESTQQELGALPIDSLVALFNNLDLQALSLVDDGTLAEWRDNWIPKRLIGSSFASLSDASAELDVLMNNILELVNGRHFVFTTKQPHPIPETRLQYCREFEAWEVKFSELKKATQTNPANEEGLLALEIRSIIIKVALNLDHTRFGLCWDDFESDVARIVDLSDLYLRRFHVSSALAPLRVFSFSATVCDTLYVASSCCRNRELRRKAIHLMKRWPRREGFWDSVVAARVSESIMVIEEEGIEGDKVKCSLEKACIRGEYICQSHRVLDTDLELVDEGFGNINLRRVGDLLQGLPGQTVKLEW